MEAVETVVRPHLPVDLVRTLAPTRRAGAADPTVRLGARHVWRATRTPEGAATIHLNAVSPTEIRVRAWGPGAAWAVAGAPRLIGADDDGGGLEADADPRVRGLARRFAAVRLGATAAPLEALVPAILEQKVQGQSAKASYRALLRAHATPAPVPDDPGAPRLLLPPSAPWLVAQPPWVWHRWGVEAKRATTIRVAASYARRVAETAAMAPAAARHRLTALPGVGPWTAAEVAQAAFGDPDAVSVGDFWLCHWVCHNLAGEARGTDERMLELLEPWTGQRGRVCRLLLLGGDPPPRFGPRLPYAPIARL